VGAEGRGANAEASLATVLRYVGAVVIDGRVYGSRLPETPLDLTGQCPTPTSATISQRSWK
jgi:hypothetical protein